MLKIKHFFKLGSLALLPAIFTPSFAQQDYLAEDDFFGDSPVVLTVSRMHKPLAESPASVTVIDRQMIRNSGAREVSELFRMVPGFIVGNLKGHLQVVTYQGLGEEFHRQMQVLIDGRSVFIPSFGGVPWANLPLLLQDIERIEVIRGPNSVTYGANAFLATINIITRHAAEDLGTAVSVTHDLDRNSQDENIYLRYGNQIEDFDFRITAGREEDDGYSDLNDGKTLEKLNIRTDFLTSYNQFWSIQAGINQAKSELGKTADNLDPLREEDTVNQYLNIKWELQQDSLLTQIKLTHTNQDVNDSYDVIEPLFNTVVSFDRESDRTDLEIFQNRTLSKQLMWNYGLSYRHDKVNSFFLFHDDENKSIKTWNVFSSMEWKPDDSLTLDAGFLIEDTNFTKKDESLRLSVIKQIGNQHLRFVSSSAIRNPILWELEGWIQFDVTVNPAAPPPLDVLAGMTVPIDLRWLNKGELNPEKIISNEIGLFSEYPGLNLTTDIKLFEYEISDQLAASKPPINDGIPLPPLGLDTEGYREIYNAGKTKVNGVEISFNYSPEHKQFRFYGGLTFLNRESFDQSLEDSFPTNSRFIGGHLQLRPKHLLSGLIYNVDRFSWTDRSDQLDGYTKLDLRYQITLQEKNDINLEIIGKNLADQFGDYLLNNQQERSVLLRISGRF